MTMRRGLALTAAAIAVTTTVACGAGSPASSPAPAGVPAAQPAAALTANELAFAAKVRTIVPGLDDSDEKLARRGANSCDALTAVDATTGKPWTAEKINAQIRERFGPDGISLAQAGRIADAARATVCR